ncbi:isochorismate synthase [Lutibacter citreus]|uniref:isochorismate synthase n=1 Tax=Lutibacter citreus TaxID=2138210 RepID=UPI000DBE7C97|nr:isochorismate synthase [Lutibacter citreus]
MLHLQLENFFSEIEQSLTAKVPFVAFRKPNETKLTLYIQQSKELFQLKDYDQKGFVFAPFTNKEVNVIFPLEKCDIKVSNSELNQTKEGENLFNVISSSKNESEYIDLVNTTISFLQTTEAEKVVVSRKETIEKQSFDVLKTYKKILNNYKNAFAYCWFHPLVGLWMGASPERFLNIENNEFKTISLAGTQVYKNTTNVVWKSKEKEEQQFVTNFIIDSIKNVFKEIKVQGPYTVQAGSLLHLRTDILAPVTSNNLIEKLVLKLHPTPAVCGLPKQLAKDFIVANEGYNRSYYTGFLGELNINNSTNFYVNLRCMEVEKSQISIYIGGGITKSSIAQNEWNETVDKAEVMKKVL